MKGTFRITVIRKDRENDFYRFWDENIDSNANGEELHSDLVGFNIIIEANNMFEAISIAKTKYPELTICKQYSSKIC